MNTPVKNYKSKQTPISNKKIYHLCKKYSKTYCKKNKSVVYYT